MFYKRLMLMTAVVTLLASSAMAQGFRDAGAKMRGEFGGTPRQSVAAPMYRYSAPVVVQRQTAPPAVAQTPTQRRNYSYEPAQQAAPCHPAPSAPPQAQPQAPRRSYSYEPAAPTYRAPAPGPRRSAPPSYLLPKTDPRRYGR